MVMSWIFTIMLALSVLASAILGNGGALAAAVPKGAQAGLELALSLAGSICLWSGVGKLMEKAGLTDILSRCFSPLSNGGLRCCSFPCAGSGGRAGMAGCGCSSAGSSQR